MTTGIIFGPEYLRHEQSPTHPERNERLAYTVDQLMEEGLFDHPDIIFHSFFDPFGFYEHSLIFKFFDSELFFSIHLLDAPAGNRTAPTADDQRHHQGIRPGQLRQRRGARREHGRRAG